MALSIYKRMGGADEACCKGVPRADGGTDRGGI